MKSKPSAYRLYTVEEHSIRSQAIAQTFSIKVLQPFSRIDGTERFPVLYMTDGDDTFGACASLANALQLTGEAQRFILVAIGYGNPAAAELLRMRDLLTHEIRALFQPAIERLAASDFVAEVDDLHSINQTTDARDFLHFMRRELMPYIDTHYPTLADDNAYFGYSAGGSFGLFTLFTEPDTFRRYILGSPALSYAGQHFGISLARQFLQSRQTLRARLFMSVGELEELHPQLGDYDLVTGYYKLARFLKQAAIPGLDLTLRLFPDETHATALPPAFSHGVRSLMRPHGEMPVWTAEPQ